MQKPAPAAARYREQEVLTAPPGRLLVITYDALLTALTRARIGAQTGNPELTVRAIQQARDLIGELLVTLDREKGGEIARNLGSLYVFLLQQLQAGGRRPDAKHFDRLVQLVTPIRDAFAEVAQTPAGAKAAVA
ncbi:MAG: flagellar export chaperone FliS [Gemmatimonadetes bacterium]|nr:flagellar export chaperone FliS [Gemmatimonadota bacterium]